jgi:hypothetical protein
MNAAMVSSAVMMRAGTSLPSVAAAICRKRSRYTAFNVRQS